MPAPRPAEGIRGQSVTAEDVPVWYHVYNSDLPYDCDDIRRGWGDTRFAPVNQGDGTPARTYYVASSREAVCLESVLHNVSLLPPGVLETASLRHFHLVKLQLETPLEFVSFHTLDLPRLNLTGA